MKKKGFTLVELLVVIAILAILATVSIVGYTGFIGKANESVCLQEATQIRDLIIAEDINNDDFHIDGDKIVFDVTDNKKPTSDSAALALVVPTDSELKTDLAQLKNGTLTITKEGAVTYVHNGGYTATINFSKKIETAKTPTTTTPSTEGTEGTE